MAHTVAFESRLGNDDDDDDDGDEEDDDDNVIRTS